MKSLKWFLPVAAISATLGCLSLVSQVSADEDKDKGDQKGRRRVVVIDEEPGEEEVVIDELPGKRDVIVRRRERRVPEARYMLGIRCEQDDAGVFVADVLEGMPAEKAGVKAEDRIAKIGDTEIKDIKALIDTVQNSDGKDLKLTIKRGDDELSISVAPVRQEMADLDVEFSERGGDFFRRFLPFQDDRLFRLHPGFVFGEHEKLGEFPKNVSISINRSNDGPANITVERDGKTWTVDEKTIDQLPEDLRAWARRMLAASNGDMLMPEIQRLPEQFVVPGPRRIRGDRLIPRVPQADHDEDLDELKKEVQKLREMVEKLQTKE